MTLDKENELLNDAIRATAECMGILPAFVDQSWLEPSVYEPVIVFSLISRHPNHLNN